MRRDNEEALGRVTSAAMIVVGLSLAGCVHPTPQTPIAPPNATAPPVSSNAATPSSAWVSEECTAKSDDQIDSFIDGAMQTVAAVRSAAASPCTTQPGIPYQVPSCPPGTYPIYCSIGPSTSANNLATAPADAGTDPKNAYNSWLSYVAGAITSYSPPPIGQPVGANYGLGQQYGQISQAAQTLDQKAAACPMFPNPPNQGNPQQSENPYYQPPGSNPCGKDTDCMQRVVQQSSFMDVGETLFLHFVGCSRNTRQSAARYLQQKYSW